MEDLVVERCNECNFLIHSYEEEFLRGNLLVCLAATSTSPCEFWIAIHLRLYFYDFNHVPSQLILLQTLLRSYMSLIDSFPFPTHIFSPQSSAMAFISSSPVPNN